MSDNGPSSVFVGIGVGRYEDPSFQRLPRAVPDVEEIARLLGGRGSTIWLAAPHPSEQEAYAHLSECLPPNRLDAGSALIVLWAGHALPTPEPALHLIGRCTQRDAAPLVSASTVAGIAARSGARQILIVLDTCYSGDGAMPAMAVAVNVQAELAASKHSAWVGVLTSTLPAQPARDGVFCKRLAQLLDDGPRDALEQRSWSPHETYVSLEDIAYTLAREWDEPAQTPQFNRAGIAQRILPNPLFDQAAPDAIVEHLLLAARGSEPGEETSYFTGRVEPINHIVSWLDSKRPGVLVVTGPAGSGKSAIVGRIVSLSDPEERARILGTDPLEHDDPGEKSVQAHIPARGLTAERLVEELDRRLVNAGVLEAQDSGRRNRGELFGALERAGMTPAVAIDGLDEAGSEAVNIAEDVIRLLRTHIRFLVGTRERFGPSLLEALAPDVLVGLGDEHFAEQTSDDAIGYVVKRLAGIASNTMDPSKVGHLLAKSATASGEGVFLLARIVTAQLRETPIDTTLDGWEMRLATAIDTAVEHDLDRIRPLTRDGRALPDAGRDLLTALAWSYGAGMPDDIWTIASTALSPMHTTYTRQDILWLLDNAGRYVVESGEGGRAAYRLAHQRVADYLLPSRRIDRIEANGARLATGLAAYYTQLLKTGTRPDEPPYLWRYTWRHAADGGADGIKALRALVDLAPAPLLPDLASALNTLGNRYAEVGRRDDALAPAEEAVSLYRELAAENAAYLPNLAGALNNLGNRYAEVGRRRDAVAPTEEAVRLRGELAAENAAYLPDLAGALSNLGIRYAEVGRRDDALAPTEEAVRLRGELAAENAAYLPDLASALNNLGNRYAEVGRRRDAVAPTEEAVRLRGELVAENAAYLPDLASALNNLGNRYAEVGRRRDAVAPTEEAVGLYRELAAENAAYLPNLASALNNLGACYADVGRRDDAIAPTEEAVRLRGELAAENAAYLPDLASALSNLGACYAEVGRRDDAVAPTEEAVRLCRELAAENAAYLPDLAGALNNLGACYAEVGRRDDAVAPTEGAVGLYRELAAENVAYLPDLAGALSNLGAWYAEVGRREDAIAPIEEAVRLRRELAAENAAYLPDLARALNNLGKHYRAIGRDKEIGRLWRDAIEHIPDADDQRRLQDLRDT